MNERSLAHIEIIESLNPIENADKIEIAKVLGWNCVVKKGEFKVGEKIIFCEIDSVLPDKPEYEFLRKYNFRVRTQKLRGVISQGLVLPLTAAKNLTYKIDIGFDVTELLEITKYLSPSEREEISQQERKLANEKNKFKKFMMRYSWFRKLFLSRKQKSGFPYWCTKSDELRCQSLHWEEFYEQFKDKEVYITEKIDFQSVTFTGKMIPKYGGLLGRLIPIKKYKFIVCSRNFTTNDKNSLYWKIAQKYNIEKILRENPNLTIQGEQGDTKVQGNKYGITEPTMWVFNIIDHEKNYHYDIFEIDRFCEKYNLMHVPMVSALEDFVSLKSIGSTVQELVEYSKGNSVLANILREGIVVRCIENGSKVFSFKVINPLFLLRYDS